MNTYHFTEEQLRNVLAETIDMYEEYQRAYGHSKQSAKFKAEQETIEGLDAEQELSEIGEVGISHGQLGPYCSYCHTNHFGYQDHQGA